MDMKNIKHALCFFFPDNTVVLSAASNSGDRSGDSIAVMAQRLATEICDYCTGK